MPENYLPYWLAVLYLPNTGPRKILRWLHHFANIKALFVASKDELLAAGVPQALIPALTNPCWELVEADLAWAQISNQHLIAFTDEKYPAALKEIADPPLVLYVRGNAEALQHIQIAIVGSRNATASGIHNATYFARALTEVGLAITSGLALGVDAASHRGALAAKGITIAICGTGLQHIYPAAHTQLVEDIINQNGAVVSEFPLASPPVASHFPRRNRIIGGLCIGVLVVEAALKSGSLITARHALEQGREVFAIPGSIHHPLARGCHYLIKQGAKLVETAADIIEELSVHLKKPTAEVLPSPLLSDKAEQPLQPKYSELLSQIGYEITPVDMITLRSGLTANELSSMLLTLELDGYVQSVPGGYVRGILNH